MFRILRGLSPLMLIIALLFVGCTSQELTSAKLYIQQENWEKAEEFLLAALIVEPENPEVPYLLGKEVYMRNEDWVKMNEMFDKALSLGADKIILQGAPVKEYVNNARGEAWANAYNNAVQTFNTVRGKEGDDKNKALDMAIEGFELATKINPKEPQNYSILSLVYAERELNDKALATLETGMSLKIEEPKLYVTMGQVYLKLVKLEESASALKKALELDASNLDATKLLAQIYYDLTQIEDAVATYEKAIDLEEDDLGKADLHFNLGILYMKMGEIDNAEDNFMESYDLNPEDAEAVVGIAQTFETAERWRSAEKWYKEAIFLDPENASHYRSMARVLIKQGKTDDATRYYEKSKRFE